MKGESANNARCNGARHLTHQMVILISRNHRIGLYNHHLIREEEWKVSSMSIAHEEKVVLVGNIKVDHKPQLVTHNCLLTWH